MSIHVSSPVLGNAGAGDVRSSKTFSGVNVTPGTSGTLVTQANPGTVTPGTADKNYAAGIYDAAFTVKGDANLVAGNIANGVSIFGVAGTSVTAAGSATPADVKSGVTFTSAGAGGTQTGTMPAVAGSTITPGTAQQTAIAAGSYATGAINVAGDANLIAANILSGKSIFGVAGTVIQGKQSATGTFPSLPATTGSYTASGLAFTPTVIISQAANGNMSVSAVGPSNSTWTSETAIPGWNIPTQPTSGSFTLKNANGSNSIQAGNWLAIE